MCLDCENFQITAIDILYSHYLLLGFHKRKPSAIVIIIIIQILNFVIRDFAFSFLSFFSFTAKHFLIVKKFAIYSGLDSGWA